MPQPNSNSSASDSKNSDQNQLVIHGIYRHYKGNYYIVEDVATHSETDEELVIYRGLYFDPADQHGQFHLCARPKGMFLSTIDPTKIPAGQKIQKYRFELQDIPSQTAERQTENSQTKNDQVENNLSKNHKIEN